MQQNVELDAEVEQEAIGRPSDRSNVLKFDSISKRQRRRSETVRKIYQHFFAEDDDFRFGGRYGWGAPRPVNNAKDKLSAKGKLLLEQFKEGEDHCGTSCRSREYEGFDAVFRFLGRPVCEEHLGGALVKMADMLDMLYVQGIHVISEDCLAEIINHFEDYKIALDLKNLPSGFYINDADDCRTLRFSSAYKQKKKRLQAALEDKTSEGKSDAGVLYHFYQQLIDASERLNNLVAQLSRHFGGEEESRQPYLELLFSHYGLVAKLNRVSETSYEALINLFIDVTGWDKNFDVTEANRGDCPYKCVNVNN